MKQHLYFQLLGTKGLKELIDYLATECGVASDYIDAWGHAASVSVQSQTKAMRAMGYDLSDEQSLITQLEDEALLEWHKPLETVYVCRLGQVLNITLKCAIGDAAQMHSFKLVTEQGDEYRHDFAPVDGQLIASQELEGGEWQQYQCCLPAAVCEALPLGYHQLFLYLEDKELDSTQLILAPVRCFIPSAISKGAKYWGFSVQLYCLRSERNWGIGDFTDLAFLSSQAAALGADFIGLNPIHQLYIANPQSCSPYSPSSRRWLNYLYIDVEKVEGFDSPAMQQWIQNNDLYNRAAKLREAQWLDYSGIAELKLAALRILYNEFSGAHVNTAHTKESTNPLDAFNSFIDKGGESLQHLAIFDALQMQLKEQGKACGSWHDFPEGYHCADAPAVQRFAKEHEKELRFYMYLQWLADAQINNASEQACKSGMAIGIYRDLAVGVSEGGAEVWGDAGRDEALYCTDMSIGAPPDVLGPVGQKWGLPPMNPLVLRKRAYDATIELFRSNMQSAGALRIDHVMALLRLWWVHIDDEATDGSYVHYPIDDLLAVLALESHRNKCLVVGEDLGTVPKDIRDKLQANGVFSYRVFFFEQSEDGGFYSPAHYPEQSMAALTTHDMPTLKGYWHCDDLYLGKELGIYTDHDLLKRLFDARHEQKQRILDSLHGHGSISDSISRDVNYVGMSTSLNHAMQCHMAKGSSTFLSLQLEDWLEMDKPVNIPGTHKEYPNWQRKLSMNLEDIFANETLRKLGRALSDARATASKEANTNTP